ncbi:hypothetical protein EUGRSUZ_G01399 [Eucalyptus grandis]|uniref:Uncharacterized protein n=2 Tax=Eucalyptus grandis TaxID=71139 RepID=A0ACC3K2M7_EUCGR|nr:hypothetical protein EUGRSUZ_G01399 [Eucalyptus grandis]
MKHISLSNWRRWVHAQIARIPNFRLQHKIISSSKKAPPFIQTSTSNRSNSTDTHQQLRLEHNYGTTFLKSSSHLLTLLSISITTRDLHYFLATRARNHPALGKMSQMVLILVFNVQSYP